MDKNKILYFGYGSNLLEAQMLHRCPESKFVAIGYIPDYKIIYDGFEPLRKGPVINSIPSTGDVVWGVIYELTPHDLELLDKFEDYPTDYQRKIVPIHCPDGSIISAYFYFRKEHEHGKPHQEYVDIVVRGAREHGIPEEYIQKYLLVETR